MFFKKNIFILALAFYSAALFAQKDTTNVKIKGNINFTEGIYDPLAPSKAAFYSAIFPGMGQVYNKKYWKAPIVWAALAVPVYYYQLNNSQYKRYRSAYKLRKNGLQDEFTSDSGVSSVSITTLETAQEQLSQNRDMSLLSGVIIYILQIVEASVNAHLLQFNTDDNISFKPALIMDPIRIETPSIGLTIKYNF